MSILNALKALYKKATGKQAAGGSIAAVVQDLADNWPAAPGAATRSTPGLVKQAAPVAGAAGDTPTKAEFNALLTALQAAGILAAE